MEKKVEISSLHERIKTFWTQSHCSCFITYKRNPSPEFNIFFLNYDFYFTKKKKDFLEERQKQDFNFELLLYLRHFLFLNYQTNTKKRYREKFDFFVDLKEFEIFKGICINFDYP